MSKLDSYLYVVPHPLLPQTVLTVVTLQIERDDTQRERERQKESERERESVCVCV